MGSFASWLRIYGGSRLNLGYSEIMRILTSLRSILRGCGGETQGYLGNSRNPQI